jgi:hypothetical protein
MEMGNWCDPRAIEEKLNWVDFASIPVNKYPKVNIIVLCC